MATSKSPFKTTPSHEHHHHQHSSHLARQISDSRAHRVAYLNSEVPTKDPDTIFHSPYKSGRRNQEYSNPTFTSSSIFYSDQASNIEQKYCRVPSRSPLRYIPETDFQASSQLQRNNSFYDQNQNKMLTKNINKTSNQPKQECSPIPKEVNNVITKSLKRDKSFKEEPKPQLFFSEYPRGHKQRKHFEMQMEHLRDHFEAGLTVSSDHKPPLKKYLNAAVFTEKKGSTEQQYEDINSMDNQQLVQLSSNNQNLRESRSTQSHRSMQGSKSMIKLTNTADSNENALDTSKQNESSKQQDNSTQKTPLQQLISSQRERKRASAQTQGNRTPTKAQIEELTPSSVGQRTPKRPSDSKSNVEVVSLSPLKKEDSTRGQSHQQHNGCCDTCLNKKMASDKKTKLKAEREQFIKETNENFKRNEEERKEETKYAKELKIQNNTMYQDYLQNYDNLRMSKVKSKKEIIEQTRIQCLEQDKEVERELQIMKQQKIQKIRAYSSILQQQMEERQRMKEKQLTKEKNQQQKIDQQFQQQIKDLEMQKAEKKNQIRILNNQLEEQRRVNKIKQIQQKDNDAMILQQAQQTMAQIQELDKQAKLEAKQQQKEEYINYQHLKEQQLHNKHEIKANEQEQYREQFREIQNEEYERRIAMKEIEMEKRYMLSSLLKKQIGDKQKKIEEERITNKQQSTTLQIGNRTDRTSRNLTPCDVCHKSVSPNKLTLNSNA